MEQTLRPHSPLRVPMNLTRTTFGIRCWDCSATHMMASSWKHYWMRWIWAESRSLIMSLWVCCVTKERFIVLKEISFRPITLGESFRWLVWLHLSAQTLLGTRVRGEPALDKWRSRTRSAAGSFKYTSSGTIAIKGAVQIWQPLPQSHLRYQRLFVGHPSRLVDFSLLVVPEPSRTLNVDCTLPSFLQLPFSFVPYRGVSSCLLVGLGPIMHDGPMTGCWQSGSTCPVMFTAAYTWSCQRILACYRFLHLGTIAGRQCAIARAAVSKLAPFSAWPITPTCVNS